ncbi:MAG: hypothetical protein CMC51_02345 [Flavobacteriaceae bacterium]|nr:hypothetical protein [Flavobacteriaceae bacterium]|tara:strand:+ start:1736 stop:2077 length:342 start_codon:yes stop_codon:yes gene_type:complete
MKNLFILLSFLILFQSCFSYKSVNYDNISNNKKQKIQVEMLDRSKFNGQLVSKDDKTIILENNGSTQTILKKDVYEVKVVKFSILKTLGNVAKGGAWIAAAAGMIVIVSLLSV